MSNIQNSKLQINSIIDRIIKKAKVDTKVNYQTLNIQNKDLKDLPFQNLIDPKSHKSFLSWIRPKYQNHQKSSERKQSQQFISRLFSTQKQISFIGQEEKTIEKQSTIKLQPVKQRQKKQHKNAYFSNKFSETKYINPTKLYTDKNRVTSINYFRINKSTPKSSPLRKMSQFYLTTRNKQTISFNFPVQSQKNLQNPYQHPKSFLYKTFYR